MTYQLTGTGKKTGSLAGLLLAATPAIESGCFARSVIYLCSHNSQGAMGIIVNYPIDNVDMTEVFDQLSIPAKAGARHLPIHFGGPVEAGRGFMVHSDDFSSPEPLIAQDGMVVSANASVLHALAEGKGPHKGLLTLGYSGWSPGQLESEIESGSWLTVPATSSLVFAEDNDTKWNLAVGSLGIDMGHFSTVVGHA